MNLESISDVGGDIAIDLEVTSNRPDCLGHLGVAREIAVLFEKTLRVPDPGPRRRAAGRDADGGVTVEDRDALPAVHRPGDLGGQGRRKPVVAAQAAGDDRRPADQQHRRRDQLRHVRVRPAAARLRPRPPCRAPAGRPPRRAGETLTAINNRVYELNPEMLVIADAARPVGLAGVMGGAETEIGLGTTNVLIEAAQFDAMSVRRTSRALGLFSPSSFRFERTARSRGDRMGQPPLRRADSCRWPAGRSTPE